MNGRPDFRPLLAVDTEGAAALQAAAFASLEERPWSATEMATLLATPGVQGLLAESDGSAIGMALWRVVADEAELLTIAVQPAMHRRGAGRALLTQAVAAARAGGATSLFLEVGEDNEAALALYRAMGFEPVGRRRAYYKRITRPAADAIVLRLVL